MWWVVAGVWGGAVLVAAVVLGFAGYELNWKADRLRRDAANLLQRRAALGAVQTDLAVAQQRIAAAQQAMRSVQGAQQSRLQKAAGRRPPLAPAPGATAAGDH